MKKMIYILGIAFLIGSGLQSAQAASQLNTEMHVATRDLITQADKIIEDAPKMLPTDPSFSFQKEIINLATTQKKAAQRVLSHVDDRGNVSCYDEMTGDLQKINTVTARLKEINEEVQASFPETHTTVGWLASKIIGVKKVQTIGRNLGYCYKKNAATPVA